MPNFDQFLDSLRQEFGEQLAGKKFEVFCKWFLENDPEWSKKVDKVWLWDEYPNKWQRQDLGTDLVFKDKEGLIWAVQAKCYSEHRTTSKSDMNSFLADTGRPEVHRRLWFQTTNKIEAKAERTYKGQDKQVTIFTLNDFRNAPINYPASFADIYRSTVKARPIPDPHQAKAIKDVTTGLKTSDRGQMIMACGTGKTFTTLWIKEALEAHITLVLLPSLSLLSQTMREWAWAGNANFDILNVCSDKSVGKKAEDMDPADASFPVTSDVEEIARFMKQPKPKVVFCTYQSSDLIAQAQLHSAVPSFDLAVADEAHRCAGKADASFATILNSKKLRASKRLFTTATPRYFGKAIEDEAKARDLDVIGMDNEAVFGPVIHKLTFGQAIDQELLTDYQVLIIGVDEPMVKDWIENYEIVSTDPDNQTDVRTLASKVGLIKAIKDYDLQRVISFHSRIKAAQKFSEELDTVLDLVEPENRPDGEFLSDYVSGAMKAGERKEKIDKLKSLQGYDRGILTNARCLAEGVDVPSLDGVAFIDPKGSQVEIIQAVGRAIRKVRGARIKKKGTIVLPVFIENGDDYEASIEASNFKPVWHVLKALRAHDEVLADTLDHYRTNMAQNAFKHPEKISDKIIFEVPLSIGAEFSRALSPVLVEATTSSWSFGFGLLAQFKSVEGHCRVSQKHKINNFNLGGWVSQQRQSKDRLSQEQISKLDSIGMSWDPKTEIWDEKYEELEVFFKVNGHTKIPAIGSSLGTWIVLQRQRLTNGHMTEQQRLLLEKFPDWSWDPKKDRWNSKYRAILAILDADTEASVRNLREHPLSKWLMKQRQKKGKLSREQCNRLESLRGFSWDPNRSAWLEGFEELKRYLSENGNIPASSFVTDDGFRLGLWAARARAQKHTTEWQHELLNTLPNWSYNLREHAWHEAYRKYADFVAETGSAKVPAKYLVDGEFDLGRWVSHMKKSFEKLDCEKQALLSGLRGWSTDYREDTWQNGYSKLLEFVSIEGHACPTQSVVSADGFKLGKWVNKQRNARILDEERLQKLVELPGWSWDPDGDRWNEAFSLLKQYEAEHGNCIAKDKVRYHGFLLAAWIYNQKKQYAKGTLKSDRYKLLNSISSWSW
jgi:superfamily II DNA or RNA helicase